MNLKLQCAMTIKVYLKKETLIFEHFFPTKKKKLWILFLLLYIFFNLFLYVLYKKLLAGNFNFFLWINIFYKGFFGVAEKESKVQQEICQCDANLAKCLHTHQVKYNIQIS